MWTGISSWTTLQAANQTIPDFVSHYEWRWPKGHFQLASVLRVVEYKNIVEDTNKHFFGYGFNLSGSQILFDRDKFIWQAAAGEGIARYLVSFGGGGWDAIPNFKDDLTPVPVYGGYLAYQHFWDKRSYANPENSHFSSTFVYGYVNLKNELGQPAETLLTGSYASANLYWNIVAPINIAVEGIYGFRTDEFGSSGDNLRIQLVMEYNF